MFEAEKNRSPHRKDLRKGRFSQPGGIYLLTWTTQGRRTWFSDFYLGRQVVASMRRAQEAGTADSLAFVVMPDHVHWLVSLGRVKLAELMRDVKGHSGFHVKRRIRQQGGDLPKIVWEEGYHDHALRSEENVQDVARYIIMNPVRAGLVKSVRDYPLWEPNGCRSGLQAAKARLAMRTTATLDIHACPPSRSRPEGRSYTHAREP